METTDIRENEGEAQQATDGNTRMENHERFVSFEDAAKILNLPLKKLESKARHAKCVVRGLSDKPRVDMETLRRVERERMEAQANKNGERRAKTNDEEQLGILAVWLGRYPILLSAKRHKVDLARQAVADAKSDAERYKAIREHQRLKAGLSLMEKNYAGARARLEEYIAKEMDEFEPNLPLPEGVQETEVE